MKTSDIRNLGNAYRSMYEAKIDDKEFKPHMMYDPETGEAHKAEKPEDHERMSKMGYTHEKPEELDEIGRFSASKRADSLEKKADKVEKKFNDKDRIRVAKDRIRGAKAKHKAGIASRKAAKKPSVSSSTPEPETTTEAAGSALAKTVGAATATGGLGYVAGKKSNDRKVTVVHKSKVKKEDAEVDEGLIKKVGTTLAKGTAVGAGLGAAKNLNTKRKEKNLIKKARAYNDLYYGEDKEVEEAAVGKAVTAGQKVTKLMRKGIAKEVGNYKKVGLTPHPEKIKRARKSAKTVGDTIDKAGRGVKAVGSGVKKAAKGTAKGVVATTGAVTGYKAVKEKKLPRQMLDPKKDVMVVKNNKVIVIDKSKEAEYLKKGWGLAEQVDEAVKLGKGPVSSRLKFGKRLEVGDTVYCNSNGEEAKITKIIGKHDRDSGTFEVKLKKSGKVMKKSLDQLSHDDKMDDVYEEVSPVISPTQELNELKKTIGKVLKPVKNIAKKADDKVMAGMTKIGKGDAYTKNKKTFKKQMSPGAAAADVARNAVIATPVYAVVQNKKKKAKEKAKETVDKVADFGDDITKDVKAKMNTMKSSTKKESVSEGKRGAVAGGLAGGLAGQKLGGGVARIAGGAALGAIAGSMTQDELKKVKVAKKAAELRKLTKKESTEMTEGDVKDLAMKIDKIVVKMNKDSKLKPFAKKFASMAMDTMDIEKSLEKALPSSISGAKMISVLEKKLDPVDDAENDKKFKDRKDKDIDNDGDVDDSDEYLHNRRAKVDDAIDAKKKEKKDTPEISKIGEEFVNFLESALTHEPMDSKESPKGKEFISKHKKSDKDLEDKEEEAEEQTPKAGKVTKEKSGKRSIDSPVGDKNIVKSTEAPIKEDADNIEEGILGGLAGYGLGAAAGKAIGLNKVAAGLTGAVVGSAAQNALKKKAAAVGQRPVIIRQQVENESVSLVDQARAHLAGEKNPDLFGKPPAPKKVTNPYDARTKEAKKFMQRMDKRRGVKRD